MQHEQRLNPAPCLPQWEQIIALSAIARSVQQEQDPSHRPWQADPSPAAFPLKLDCKRRYVSGCENAEKASLRLTAPALTMRRKGVRGRIAYQRSEAVSRNLRAALVHPQEKPGSWECLPLHRILIDAASVRQQLAELGRVCAMALQFG